MNHAVVGWERIEVSNIVLSHLSACASFIMLICSSGWGKFSILKKISIGLIYFLCFLTWPHLSCECFMFNSNLSTWMLALHHYFRVRTFCPSVFVIMHIQKISPLEVLNFMSVVGEIYITWRNIFLQLWIMLWTIFKFSQRNEYEYNVLVQNCLCKQWVVMTVCKVMEWASRPAQYTTSPCQ